MRLVAVEELELSIEKLVAGGDGLGRFEGVPILVPRSAPGDRLKVRIVERHPDYGRAEIVEVLVAGPGRRKPPCPHFDECGGCDLQHLEDGLQTRYKAEALLETLARLGGLTELPQIQVRVASPWRYRLRAQLHTELAGETLLVGYHARGSHRLVPIVRCPILVPELEALLPTLAGTLGPEAPRRLDLAVGDQGTVSAAPVVEGLPHGELTIEVAGTSYAFDARCFFQTHRGLLEALVEEVVGEWSGGLAVDLYAGVGLFSLPLARRYGRVVAVEGDRVATRYARTNARRNRLPGIEVVGQSVEGWIEGLPPAVDRVVLDPPRAGLPGPVKRVLLDVMPPRLTLVSCHPATLARDLRTLCRRYRVERVTALDLFPQTGHLETVVHLVPAEPVPERAEAVGGSSHAPAAPDDRRRVRSGE